MQTKRSITPKRQETQQKFLELNNASYCGDCQNFTFEGFGFILWDDGDFFVGTFHRDQIQGIGVLFTKQREMIYSNFNKRSCDGITIYRNQDIIWCGLFQNSRPQEPTYTFTRKTSTWVLNENPEVLAKIQLPKLPAFMDKQIQEAVLRMLNFDFEFQIPKQSQSFIRFKIQQPPPYVKGVFESYTEENNENEESLKFILDDLKQYQMLTYLGFLRLDDVSQRIMPYGVGVYIDPINLKIHLAGSFVNGWLDGLGIMKYNDGSSVIGCFRHSILKGDCLVYDASSAKHYILKGDQIQEQQVQIDGTPSQTDQVCRKIHKSSIYYMDKSLSFKKLSGINIRSIVEKIFTTSKFKYYAKENHIPNQIQKQQKVDLTPPKSKTIVKKNNLIKNISLILSRIKSTKSNTDALKTETSIKTSVQKSNVVRGKNRVKTLENDKSNYVIDMQKYFQKKLKLSRDQETQTIDKLQEVLQEFMDMANNNDPQKLNLDDSSESKKAIFTNQVPQFTNNRLSNLFTLTGPQLSNSVNRSRIHLSTSSVQQPFRHSPLQKSLVLNQSKSRSKQKIFESSNFNNSKSRSKQKIFDQSESPKSKSPNRISPLRISPQRISPQRISPQRISPQRISPQRISPQRISPNRKRIFSKKIFD